MTTSVMDRIVRRKEDPALIHGEGRYVDDIKVPGEPRSLRAGGAANHASRGARG